MQYAKYLGGMCWVNAKVHTAPKILTKDLGRVAINNSFIAVTLGWADSSPRCIYCSMNYCQGSWRNDLAGVGACFGWCVWCPALLGRLRDGALAAAGFVCEVRVFHLCCADLFLKKNKSALSSIQTLIWYLTICFLGALWVCMWRHDSLRVSLAGTRGSKFCF